MLGWLKWWARLEVRGLEVVPAGGPVLVVSNPDS
jgi:1-acyl-sn-glycerol-3-phosphate acyltransferase